VKVGIEALGVAAPGRLSRAPVGKRLPGLGARRTAIALPGDERQPTSVAPRA
jgi:hypothetical protein